jgi:hypothetical protein
MSAAERMIKLGLNSKRRLLILLFLLTVAGLCRDYYLLMSGARSPFRHLISSFPTALRSLEVRAGTNLLPKPTTTHP